MEAGFIGFWGEWHHSTNGLDNSENRRKILNKILSVLPSERMVAVRVSTYKTDALNNSNPLTPETAFNSSYRARTGYHNDCFLANSDDEGTYDSSDPESTKTFLNFDTRYVVQGGESCTTSRRWREFTYSLLPLQGFALISPLEGFSHCAIEIIDEFKDAGF